MNRPIEDIRRALSGTAGPELLTEIWHADWNVPTARKIEATIDVAIGVHLGSRRKRNEDRAGMAHVKSLCGQGFAVALVCDGVGGSEMGDMAATIALASCVGDLAELRQATPVRELLPRVIRSMDDAVRRALAGKGATTASVLLASSEGDLVAANVGDSRLFAWNQSEQQLRQVSVDDTLENELRNLPGADISALNARGLQGSLSQALGEAGRSSSDLRIVVFERSEFGQGAVIASDGAWKAAPDGFAAIVRNAPSAADLVRRVVTSALWMGGIDNVSVVAIQDVEQFINLASYDVDGLGRNRITFWFADTKLVLNNVYGGQRPEPIPPRENGRQDKPSAQLDKKSARKPSGRNRKKMTVTSRMNPQLDLEVEGESRASEQYNETKPKIVVSTDDDSPKSE